MRSVFLLIVLLMLCPFLRAQNPVYAGKLIEYRPSPGQHINEPSTGTPFAASKIVEGISDPISLGAYGGYVVLGFNSPVENHPDNPYGMDFIVYGNASSTHAEPGIVKVMKDENQNGLPDDTWYEIAGSAHFTHDYLKDYTIQYQNPGLSTAADVLWTDSFGNSGKIYKNSFHSQPYYPLKELFPGISEKNMTFKGSKLSGKIGNKDGLIVSLPYAFGYADNVPVKNLLIKGIPDNPYTLNVIEGDGGDAIDISWAVDTNGNYFELDKVSFVMIYTGVNESAGWLGEISTDIRGIADISPDKNIGGQQKMILPEEIPAKIALSDSLDLNARVLFSGRPANDEEILWESLNPEILEIKESIAFAKNPGDAVVKASLVSDPAVSVISKISVVVPQSLLIEKKTELLQAGDTLVIEYSLADQTGEMIFGLTPDIIVENPNVAELLTISESQIVIKAKESGTSSVIISYKNYPLISRSFELEVIENIVPIQISFSLSNENVNILPAKSYLINKADILSFTDRHHQDFNPDRSFISLADAIATVLESEGFSEGGKSLAFRQDEYGGSGLYVWQIGFDWEYHYGWGGSKKSSQFAKTWFAIVNNEVFASGFDTIKIADGDRVSLQHIEDNSNSWSHIRIIPPKKDIVIGEAASFQAEKIDVNPSENGSFTVSGPFPVVDIRVMVDTSHINASESDGFTSYRGDFVLVFNKGGFHQVSVEDSEPLKVKVMHPLNVGESPLYSLYPNPCTNWLGINFPDTERRMIRILSLDGKIMQIKKFNDLQSGIELDVSDIQRGIYILEVVTDKGSFRQKFMKY